MARRRRGGDFEMEARLRGGKETARGFDEIAEAQQRAGRQTEEMSSKGGRLSGIFGRLTGDVKGFITGLLGLSAVQRVLDDLIRGFERIIQLRKEITQEGLLVRETTNPLAAQLFAGGGLTIQQAQNLGVESALQIARGGVDLATATQLGIAGDIALKGGLRSAAARKRNLPILQRIGGFSGGRSFRAEESGKLLEVLAAFGLTGSEEEVFRGIAQTEAASAKSISRSPGQFLNQVQASAAALSNVGFDLPQALELNVQARQVARSELAASETLKVLARKVQSGKVAEFINQRFGVDFFAATANDQLALLRRLFKEADTKAKRAQLVPAFSEEEASRLGILLGPANIEDTSEALPAILAADPDAVLRSARKFIETNLGRQRVIAADRAASVEQRSRATAVERDLRLIAERRRKDLIEDRQIGAGFFSRFLRTEEAVEEELIVEALLGEAKRLGLPAPIVDFERLVEQGKAGRLHGVLDTVLTDAIRKLQSSAEGKGVTINITNMGTVFFPNQERPQPRFDPLNQR